MRHRPHGRVSRFCPGVAALEERRLLSADVLTYHYDNARTGADPNETILTPGDVNPTTFGKLGFDAVDGKVDAQPLYMEDVAVPGQGTHNVLYVATENDSLYAFDADTGAQLWRASMLGTGEVPSDPVAGSQVTPEIGITSTPVIDPTTNTLYLVAMSKLVSGGTTTYIQRIHAIDIASGADKVAPHSIDSSITYPGAGPGGNGSVVIFDPKQYEERDALLLDNGVVYTGWASHSDNAPYTSWLIGFNANDLSLASVLNLDPNGAPVSSFLDDGSGNSFWNSGAGPAADSSGNIYNLTANGPFDPNLNAAGFPTNGDYGDSFIRVTPSQNGTAVTDYFAPFNQQQLANTDADLGSSGLLLADVPGPTGVTEHLAIGSGKDGVIYVVNRDDLGKYQGGANGIFQEITGALGGGEFGAPVVFNNEVYFGAVGSTLKAFEFVNGKLTSAPVSQTAESFVYPGTTPAVSADGTADGIVWAAENGPNAILHAYNAADLSQELYSSTMAAGGRDDFGVGNKFITPMVADGHVYVGTTNGVGVFGLFPVKPPPPPPVKLPNPPLPITVPNEVDLSSQFNRVGIVYDGASFVGGLDGNGLALSANQLGTFVASGGVAFGLGPVGVKNVVSAGGQTVSIPHVKDTGLKILLTGVNGDHANRTFVVTYTDGTRQFFRRAITDWTRTRRVPGQPRPVATAYRDASNGTRVVGTTDLSVVTLTLNRRKTVASLTLPDDGNVEVLSVTTAPAPTLTARAEEITAAGVESRRPRPAHPASGRPRHPL